VSTATVSLTSPLPERLTAKLLAGGVGAGFVRKKRLTSMQIAVSGYCSSFPSLSLPVYVAKGFVVFGRGVARLSIASEAVANTFSLHLSAKSLRSFSFFVCYLVSFIILPKKELYTLFSSLSSSLNPNSRSSKSIPLQ